MDMISEINLEEMIRSQVAATKSRYPCWPDPEMLCKELGIRVEYGKVGLGREGAAFANAVLLDPTAGVPARRRFTFYHEIVHHLLREYAIELYSIINDQYKADELLTKISERLCNVGAAEFLLPRDRVRSLYSETGFSVTLIEILSNPRVVSRVAALAQLAFCAPHSCIGVVCRKNGETSVSSQLLQEFSMSIPREVVKIDVAFPSRKMKYSCTPGTEVPRDHFLVHIFDVAPGKRMQSRASIPFKSGKIWKVDCEAVRLGEQVFAFFHVEAPPISVCNQLYLPF